MNTTASIPFAGTLSMKVKRAQKAPLLWRIKNALTPDYLKSWMGVILTRYITRLLGFTVMTSQLSAKLFRADGRVIDFGVVSRRIVTTAGVTYLAADWIGGAGDISNMKFHGVGTGAGAEAIGDTALTTESTTALNPDSTRATGVMTNPSANVVRSVGTVLFDNTAAIIEHGIFSQAATGGGTLWDRSIFSAINVVSGDSIVFTYDLTLTAGG